MTYELVKTLHLISVFIFLCSSVAILFSAGSKYFLKSLTALFSFAILFSGLAVLHKMNVGFPLWALGKGVLWIVICGLAGLCAMRLKFRYSLFTALLMLAGMASFFAIYKPH